MALATGCSNDETTELNNGNAIDFRVTAGKLTRAAATTTNTIEEFKVWAFTDSKTYMDGTQVTGGNGKWTYSGTKFWPESAVDFFAVSPMNTQGVSVANESKEIKDYVVGDGKTDLLYSANIGETKANHESAPVAVNFRHALSQIVFKAKLTDNSTIDVKIKGVKIDSVANKGTLTWASETTGPNIAAAGNTDTETGNKWGVWNVVAESYGTYAMDFNAISVAKDAAEIGEPLFLLPQTLNPWLTLKDGKPQITGKARLLVNCQIVDKESGIQLWPKNAGEFAEVAISLDNPKNDPNREKAVTDNDNDPKHDKWMQGKKYTYTLIFGEGGGYTPGPNPDPDPDPVLVPIKFEVTVDEFQNGGEYDYPANNPANP